MAMGNRKIGLGVMGWADMLILLGIPYASRGNRTGRPAHAVYTRSHEGNVWRAGPKQGSIPNWQAGHFAGGKPLRNATRNQHCAHGNHFHHSRVSSSIEPLFALAFQRMHVLQDETMDSVNGHFVEYLNRHGLFSNDIPATGYSGGHLPPISMSCPIRSGSYLPQHLRSPHPGISNTSLPFSGIQTMPYPKPSTCRLRQRPMWLMTFTGLPGNAVPRASPFSATSRQHHRYFSVALNQAPTPPGLCGISRRVWQASCPGLIAVIHRHHFSA